jgi:hypothetical protein
MVTAENTAVQDVSAFLSENRLRDPVPISQSSPYPLNPFCSASSRQCLLAIYGLGVSNVDAGMSNLIGSLTSSTLDNGKGSNRATIMKYQHEAETGRTLSNTSHLMGFDENGDAITSHEPTRRSWHCPQGTASSISHGSRWAREVPQGDDCWTVKMYGRLRITGVLAEKEKSILSAASSLPFPGYPITPIYKTDKLWDIKIFLTQLHISLHY